MNLDKSPNKDSSGYKRLIDGQPIIDLVNAMAQAGRKNFTEQSVWEICLCALILKLKPNCTLNNILEALPYDQSIMDDCGFLNTMAHLGYYCRPLRSGADQIDARLLPAVFISADRTPSIILGRDNENNLHFFDPVSKLISHIPATLDNNGVIWFFQKYDENFSPTSQFMRAGTGHGWFRAVLGRFYGTFMQIITASLILNIIALLTPLFIMLVYDRVIAAGSVDILPMLCFGALIAIFFEWRLRNIRSSGLSWFSGRIDNIVSNKIFSHLIGLQPNLIESASVAAQIARIKTFESIRDFFSGSMFLSVLEAPFVILSIAAIAFIAGPLVFVPCGMAGLYLILFYVMRKKIKSTIRLAAKASSAKQQFVIETFEKMRGIRVHGLGFKWHEKFRHVSGRETMASFRLAWLGIIAETLAHTITVLAAVLTVSFGVHLIWAGVMSTGALVAVMILVWRVLTPFYSLCTMIPRLEQLRNSIVQIDKLMDIKTETEEARIFARLSKLRGTVSFHNVSFHYTEESDNIFHDLSFESQAGDFTVITGANATGKATVLKLIQCMHTPSAGTIRIDGFDIRQLDAPHLRRQISYVPKHPDFFAGTIAENLRIGNPVASIKEIEEALKMADAIHDIENMPMGLETLIGGHGGCNLTSSLAMRLSLARAYLQPSSILLIDEFPNTLLSGKAGDNLKKYINQSKGRKTIVMCTYRDDFMNLSDTIVWLRGNLIPFTGNRDKMKEVMNTGAMVA